MKHICRVDKTSAQNKKARYLSSCKKKDINIKIQIYLQNFIIYSHSKSKTVI